MSDDQRVPTKVRTDTKEAGEATLSQTSERQESRIGFDDLKRQKVAIVHDWLNGMRGGELVFEGILDLFPGAEVFTLIYEPHKLSPRLREKLSKTKVHTTWLNWLPFTRQYYRHLLPLLPFAVQSLDVYPFDLVISSSHCVAKGVRKHPRAFHISYVHAPMRYMWSKFEDYFGAGRVEPWIRFVAQVVRPFLQAWDRWASRPERVDTIVANSQFIAGEILEAYGRESKVVYPFAALERFQKPRVAGSHYLMVGAFAPYKRTDLAIRAFARLGLPLKIVGQGQDEAMLRQLVKELNAHNIEFLGSPSNEQIEDLYRSCRAFVFPGEEDFGITPLEAMASGAPVIAFQSGGACETVTPSTGVWFKPQTVEALVEAIMDVETGRKRFEESEIRARAAHFNQKRFEVEFLAQVPENYLSLAKRPR
jgi:glycosyltransferase involved in cell wall biosynthesis